MKNNQNSNNEALNNILYDIGREIYLELGSEDLSFSLEVTLKFDDLQRIARFENLKVNNLPVIPSFELTEKLNKISQGILQLPTEYKLKECYLDIKPGGSFHFSPIYLNN